MARSCSDDFEILQRLGAGSFGTVFKVKRKTDELIYVIKQIRIIELSFKEQTEAINEVKLLAQMDSPYVVKYYDSFMNEDSLNIVMEFCNKGDVQNLIKKAKSKSNRCIREHVLWNVGLQVILGLHYLHKKKILHRDLKTANVFLTRAKPYFGVKIGDLGVAKLLDTSTAFAQTIVGTPYYLSPELCSDQPYRDKSDCWALGVILYECATLDHPFDARNQCALILKIIQSPVVPPSPEFISPELSQLILWLLQKDPRRRPSIKEILNERFVRQRLQEHEFELPVELENCATTTKLGSGGNNNAAITTTSTKSNTSNSSTTGSTTSSKASTGGNMMMSPPAKVSTKPRLTPAPGPTAPSARPTPSNSHAGVGGNRVRRGAGPAQSSLARERHQIARPTPSTSRPIGNTSGVVQPSSELLAAVALSGNASETKYAEDYIEDQDKTKRAHHGAAMIAEEKDSGDKGRGDKGSTEYDDDVNDYAADDFEKENETTPDDSLWSVKSFKKVPKCGSMSSNEVSELSPTRHTGDGPGLGLGAGYESEEREEDGEVETMWSQQQEHEQGVQSHQSLAQTLIDSGDDNYDPQKLKALVDDIRQRYTDLLGNRLFQRVYGVCAGFMTAASPEAPPAPRQSKGRNTTFSLTGEEDSEEEEAPPYSHSPIDPTPDHLASTLALQDLEKTLCHHLNSGVDAACEAVFSVKVLLVLESRLEEFEMRELQQEQEASDQRKTHK